MCDVDVYISNLIVLTLFWLLALLTRLVDIIFIMKHQQIMFIIKGVTVAELKLT